jgi:hypothetical protein
MLTKRPWQLSTVPTSKRKESAVSMRQGHVGTGMVCLW